MISHPGIVKIVADGRATVAVETSGCGSCGHGSSCGLGKLAHGQASTLMVVEAPAGLRPGDPVSLELPDSHMTYTVLLGYLFPAVGLLVGSGLAMDRFHTDAAAALGAAAGFLVALIAARLAVPHLRRWIPRPQLITFSKLESHHEH